MTVNRRLFGKVWLVGAGPGAKDLITLRGLQALREADVVLYDALTSPALLNEVSPDAEQIFVGKRCGNHSMKQEDISRLMVAKSHEGKVVVRLKGGDPFVFGRGGEEALACAHAGIEFEIVPGVSAALGAAGYAGIPLTHRGTASSVAFVAAHGAGCEKSPDLSWIELSRHVDTLVIFMGGTWLEKSASALIEYGVPAARPVAVVSRATNESQVTVSGTLETIGEEVARARLTMPILIVVGEVARFADVLNWFGRARETCISVQVGSESSPEITSLAR